MRIIPPSRALVTFAAAAAGAGLFVCSTLLIDYSRKLPV
jgi:hypothetical protein